MWLAVVILLRHDGVRVFVNLRRKRMRGGDGVAELLTVEEEHIASHLEGITWAGDDTFNETRSVLRGKENHDVAVGGMTPFPQSHEGEWHFEVVGELVDRH